MENRECKRNKNCTSGIRQMIKMEGENGIEAKSTEKKVREREKQTFYQNSKREKGNFIDMEIYNITNIG
jgi:hypothetical protein